MCLMNSQTVSRLIFILLDRGGVIRGKMGAGICLGYLLFCFECNYDLMASAEEFKSKRASRP